MNALIRRIVDVRPNEWRALLLAFVFHFVVLAGYYVIRPIRDEIGAANAENLPWMFTATLLAMLAANALFSTIVARMPRRRFIPIAYRFFIVNLVVFFLLMRTLPAPQQAWIGPCFFVWVSVFNLFATTVFWAFMTDLFSNEQGKRLFGFIAVGGSLGGIAGGTITISLVHVVSTGVLVLISAVLLEVAAQCVRFFPTEFAIHSERSRGTREHDGNAPSSVTPRDTSTALRSTRDDSSTPEQPIGGGFWSGITHICRSPYLFALLLFIMLYTLTSTWAYFQQAELTKTGFADRAARTAFLANLDRWVNILTLLMQVFVTGRLMKSVGVTFTLITMPLLSLFGFAAIGWHPVLATLAVFQVMRRAATYAFMRPAREVLFTVLKREDKYKAKSFMDTFGYRSGDQLGAWSYSGMHALGLGLSAISYIAIPLIALWCAIGIWLGRKQTALLKSRV